MNFIKYTKKNIRRTPYQAVAASLVMFVTFFILSCFILLALGLQQILRFYESKPQAIAFFKDGTTEDDVTTIQNALNQTGKITKFRYVSKDEALEIYRDRNKSNPMLLELVTANILPSSLEISTQLPEDLKIISEIIKREPVVEEVVFPEDVVTSLTSATRLIRVVGLGVVSFLIAFSTLIIVMIIGFKIRVKRDEIETMKLLGASTWFIRLPYILEGVIYALTGAFFGWVMSFITLWYFNPLLRNNLGEAASFLLPIPFTIIIGLLFTQVVVAGGIGFLGSFIALRRYLHL